LEARSRSRLKELASLFIKLGLIGFGGPAVHIAMMEKEVVVKRRWMSRQHFLDLVGATNLIPGPNSTEMTMHIGKERAGIPGLFLAGACFILPAVLITVLLAYLYQLYGQLPRVQPFIYGIRPAVISIVFMAAFSLGKKAVKNSTLAAIGLLTLAAALAGLHEIMLLFLAGAAGIFLYLLRKKGQLNHIFLPLFFLQVIHPVPLNDNGRIFLIFLKIGALLYGSGYVLLPFLESELVAPGYYSSAQLNDAIAVGQITPGPVLSTASFVGWQLNGWSGSIAATIGIFLPSFFFVWLLNPLVVKMRNSGIFSSFLDAVNVAYVALIIGICFTMTRDVSQDWRSIIILVLSLAVNFLFKNINAVWIVVGGGFLGWLLAIGY
jgi:chromate transporter